MPPADPFTCKQLSKLNPRRVFFTVRARIAEKMSARNFRHYVIALKTPGTELPDLEPFASEDTAVTMPQMQMLVECLRQTESLPGHGVEIGVYRGVTASMLSSRTARKYAAVDPYIGYGGAETDLQCMKRRVGMFDNVEHFRMTSGEAARDGRIGWVSFVFIDAVHDYVNARFDGYSWSEKLQTGGLIAFHDTDSLIFPGVQRAVWEMLNQRPSRFTLFAHIDGLVVLKRS